MRPNRLALIAAIIIATTLSAGLPLAAAQVVTLALPKSWEGKKDGTMDNNPIKVNDLLLWRFDRIWPDDPEVGANYLPMPWREAGRVWKPLEHEMGGQPCAQLTDKDTVVLGIRGPWPGGGNNEGFKLAVLVFIVPTNAKYQFSGTVQADMWEGGGSPSLTIYCREAKKPNLRIKLLQTVALTNKTAIDLKDCVFSMEAGQEICFVPRLTNANSGANVTFKKFTVIAAK